FKFQSGNSGIQFRSTRESNGIVGGPQIDIAEEHWGRLYDEGGRKLLEQYPVPKGNALFRRGEWNEYVVRAQGAHITIDLSEARVIDRTDPGIPKRGIIALQVHSGPAMEIRFKDIQIKTLDRPGFTGR